MFSSEGGGGVFLWSRAFQGIVFKGPKINLILMEEPPKIKILSHLSITPLSIIH
jgi:hypothetical protein